MKKTSSNQDKLTISKAEYKCQHKDVQI